MLAMAAPKPLLIIAAVRDDSFPVEGVRAVAKYGQMLYDAYGAGDRIGLVDDSGKESLGSDPVIAEASDKGWAVCGVDRRGIGESSSAKTGWIFAVSLLLGENFVGRQAFDVQRVIDTMATTDAFAGKPIDLYGRGTNSSLMAVYAMARLERDRHRQTPLKWFLLRDEYLSHRAFVERPRARSSTRSGSCRPTATGPRPSTGRSRRRFSCSTYCARGTCGTYWPRPGPND